MTNQKNERVAVQIDLKVLENYGEELEDLLDGILADSRKDDEKTPIAEVIKALQKAGKLK